MTDAIPNASLPPSLILEVTSVFNLGKPTLTISLRTAAVSQTSTSKRKPVRLCFRCARSHRISRARKPQVWLSPRNKASPHLQGH